MRWFFLACALLFCGPVHAQMLQAIVGGKTTVSSGYTGILDIFAGADACFSLRSCSAAYATGSNPAINVRRGTDSHLCDILITSAGAVGNTANCGTGGDNGQSATAFAGTDTSGTGSISGTTLTFTGGHLGDTVTCGTCLAETVIIAGSSGSWTVNYPQTVTSTTITLLNVLYIPKWYDQSGNGRDALQATTGLQPIFIPVGTGGLPAVLNQIDPAASVTTGPLLTTSGTRTFTNSTGFAFVAVGRVIQLSSLPGGGYVTQVSAYNGGSGQVGYNWNKTGGCCKAEFSTDANALDISMSEDIYHTYIGLVTGTGAAAGSSAVDGSATTFTPGSGTETAVISILGSTTTQQYGPSAIREVAIYSSTTPSSGQQTSLQTNMRAYWGTP